jgi:hypothetical protein
MPAEEVSFDAKSAVKSAVEVVEAAGVVNE